MRLFGLFFFILINTLCKGQGKSWSKTTLLQDVDSFFFALEHSHPDLTLYCSQEQYQRAKSRLYQNILDTMTTAQFAQVMGQMFKTLKDSHSQVSYSALWNHHLDNGGCVLPIRKRGHIVSKGDLAQLIPGDSLIAINGVEIEQIDHWAKDFSLIEGNSFVSEQRMTDMLFSLTTALFVIRNQSAINITFQRNIQGKDTIMVNQCPTLNQKQWQRHLKKPTAKEPSPVEYTQKSPQTACLKVTTFAPKNFIHYHRSIRRAFKKVERNGIDTLIIDIRGNAGGLSTEVEYLYSFIDAKGYNTPSNIVGRRSNISDQKYRLLNRKWVQWWVSHVLKNQEDIYNYVQLRKQPLYSIDTVYFKKPMQQKRFVFNKTVILWADALTASAGVDFTHHFHETSRGEHWGEPVMGPMTGTFGNTFPYSLPKTQLTVNISTIRYNYNDRFQYSLEPIAPHVPIQWKRSNFIQQEDPYWNHFKKKSKLRTP